ncbi:MAG: SUMF1/EgtB/PvdO family nonheme iron enzyme [Planctomycetota bacterium]
MKTGKWKLAIGLLCVLCAFVVSPRTALANAVSIDSVSLSVTPGDGYATVTFNLSQQNSFGNISFDGIAFTDYIWIFIKFSTTNGSDGSWGHCILASGGSVTPTTDYLGAFIQSSTAGTGGNTFTIRWNYGGTGGNGVTIGNDTIVKVCAIEMVEIPTGAFYYNAGGIGGSTYNNYGGGSQTLVNTTTQIPTGAGSGWPNGYTGFYLAKYEVSQQQFCDFLNTIPSSSAASFYSSWAYNLNGYLITNTGSSPITYTTTAPNRACNFLFWSDMVPYLSWTGLRPMTEMEYEKAARKTSVGTTNTRTYPWGDTAPSTVTGAVDGGTHVIYNANYYVAGVTYAPISVGWYLSQGYAPTNREYTGASYGVADLAGNLWEYVINCAWTTVPNNGNGTITPPVNNWPGTSTCRGCRGGFWGGANTNYLRVSDRACARIYESEERDSIFGFRPARTK